jgi:hypothetical protein
MPADLIDKMFCAECGNALQQVEFGAWKACCNSAGYWYNAQPFKTDAWWPTKTIKLKYTDSYTFYPTVKWNPTDKPNKPSILE